MFENISIILMLFLVVLFLPLFLDIVFRISVRRKRRSEAFFKALQMARRKNRPLLIFTSPNTGLHISKLEIYNDRPQGEEFTGNIYDVISNLKTKSAIILLIEVLEYIDEPEFIWNKLLEISNNRIFSSNLETKSPKFWFDYRIKNIMNKTFYNKNDKIIYSPTSELQKNISRFYQNIFLIVPKKFFLDDPIKI